MGNVGALCVGLGENRETKEMGTKKTTLRGWKQVSVGHCKWHDCDGCVRRAMDCGFIERDGFVSVATTCAMAPPCVPAW